MTKTLHDAQSSRQYKEDLDDVWPRFISLEQARDEADDALRAVEAALKDVPYKGTYADGVETLIRGLAFAHTEKLELAAQNVALRSALLPFAKPDRYLGDNLGGYAGWFASNGNPMNAAQDALNLPNLASEILRKRDASVLRRAAEWFAKNTWADVPLKLERMANEIEGEAK